jgi:hypothetical protein
MKDLDFGNSTLSNLHPEARHSISEKVSILNVKFRELATRVGDSFSTTTLHHSLSSSSSKDSFAIDCTTAMFKHEAILSSIFNNLDAISLSLCSGVCYMIFNTLRSAETGIGI